MKIDVFQLKKNKNNETSQKFFRLSDYINETLEKSKHKKFKKHQMQTNLRRLITLSVNL